MEESSEDKFKELCTSVGMDKDKYVFLPFATIVLDKDYCIVRDHVTMKCWQLQYKEIHYVYEHLNALIKNEFFLREGFVDRSLNTDMYSRIDKFKYCVLGMDTNYEELTKLISKIPKNETRSI